MVGWDVQRWCPSQAFHKGVSCAFGIVYHIIFFLPKHTGFLSLPSNGRIFVNFFVDPVSGLCMRVIHPFCIMISYCDLPYFYFIFHIMMQF